MCGLRAHIYPPSPFMDSFIVLEGYRSNKREISIPLKKDWTIFFDQIIPGDSGLQRAILFCPLFVWWIIFDAERKIPRNSLCCNSVELSSPILCSGMETFLAIVQKQYV